MHPFSIKASVRFGWETLKKRPWMLIGGFVLVAFVGGTISSFFDPAEYAGTTAFAMFVISFAIGAFMELCMVTFFLKAHDSVGTLAISDLWNPKPYLYYLTQEILTLIVGVIGLILLIIPGIIFGIGLMFASYLVVDKGLGPIEAMKESWRITKGHKWQLFLFFLVLLGMNVLGLLALIVGLLVTIPISMLAIVHVYRALEHSASEVAPVPTA